MGSIAPVHRRSNNRKAQSEEILPLHHRSNGIKNATQNNIKRKRLRRPRNKPCCGVDIPVVGVVTILFVGAMVLMIGSTSLPHSSTAVGSETVDRPRHPFHYHFEPKDQEKHPHKQGRRHHKDLAEDSRRLYQNPPEKHNNNNIIAQEPEAMVVPNSPVRVVSGNYNEKTIFDVVVAGAGPSGLTAALFASRAGLKVLVLGSPSTGLLSQTKHLDNFPSFVGKPTSNTLTGPDWVDATLAQTKSWGATFGPPGLFATSMERQRIAEDSDVFFSLTTSENTEIRAWSVIAATGATPRKLGLAGEDPLWGNSLHNCAICDGHLYQGSEQKPSTVLVVGGGDASLDAALLLARYATKVVLVHRRKEFTSAHNLVSLDAVRATPNIEIMTPYVVEQWITKKEDPSQLVGAQLSSPGASENKKQTIDIDGAFVMIGASPNTKWTEKVGIALDGEGLIQTTANLPMPTSSMITASSVPGLFAAGEVTDNIYKQAITAAAAGAQAAIDAERWLREQRGVTGSANVVSRAADATNDESKLEPVAVNVDGTSDHGDGIQDNEEGEMENCDLASEDCIRSIVEAYPVVVFSKPWCPYCRKALEALSLVGLPEGSEKLLVIDLSKHANTHDIQSTLQAMTRRRTVPNVFVGGKSIGGGDETRSFQQNGKLVPLLVEAGALGDDNNGVTETQRKLHKDEAENEEEEEEESEEEEQEHWHSSSESESCDLSSEDCVRQIVSKYPAVLFSLSWCPECKETLQLLDLMGITEDQLHVIDLDDYEEIALDIRANMKALSGRRGVPNLWVGGENFGGFRQSQKIRGELEAKFREVGILGSTSNK